MWLLRGNTEDPPPKPVSSNIKKVQEEESNQALEQDIIDMLSESKCNFESLFYNWNEYDIVPTPKMTTEYNALKRIVDKYWSQLCADDEYYIQFGKFSELIKAAFDQEVDLRYGPEESSQSSKIKQVRLGYDYDYEDEGFDPKVMSFSRSLEVDYERLKGVYSDSPDYMEYDLLDINLNVESFNLEALANQPDSMKISVLFEAAASISTVDTAIPTCLESQLLPVRPTSVMVLEDPDKPWSKVSPDHLQTLQKVCVSSACAIAAGVPWQDIISSKHLRGIVKYHSKQSYAGSEKRRPYRRLRNARAVAYFIQDAVFASKKRLFFCSFDPPNQEFQPRKKRDKETTITESESNFVT